MHVSSYNDDHFLLSMMQVGVNILLHSCSIYLLTCVHKDNRSDAKSLFDRNLSNIGIIVNFILIIIFILILLAIHVMAPLSGNIVWSILLIFCTRIVYITMNKMMESILLGVGPSYCTVNKGAYVLSVVWISGVVYCIGVFITFEIKFFYILEHAYLAFTLDVLFVIIAIATNSYIYYFYRKSRATQPVTNSIVCISIILVIAMLVLSSFPQLAFLITKNEIAMKAATKMYAILIFNTVTQFAITCDPILFIFSHERNDSVTENTLLPQNYALRELLLDNDDSASCDSAPHLQQNQQPQQLVCTQAHAQEENDIQQQEQHRNEEEIVVEREGCNTPLVEPLLPVPSA